jgi:chloramphenicol O-acetyltransferase type A
VKTLLDLENWNRKDDFTTAYKKENILNSSFFIYYLHKTLVAVNAIENFKYRISEGKIYINERIDASATIGREDGTFGFSLIEYNPDFRIFEKIASEEIERIQNTTGLFTRSFDDDNLIHFSAIPWINFKSLSHARSFTFPDSCPKISFGKMITSESGQKTIAMSVHVHHGLMDGLHVGQFVDAFQALMNS